MPERFLSQFEFVRYDAASHDMDSVSIPRVQPDPNAVEYTVRVGRAHAALTLPRDLTDREEQSLVQCVTLMLAGHRREQDGRGK